MLGEFQISGIQRAKKGEPKIDVTFEINVSGLLTVTAQDQVTGSKANVVIENDAGRHNPEDVERMIAEAERLRAEDDARVKEVEEELGLEAED